MDVKQIENGALALPESLRAGLVWRLLQTLPPSDLEVSDEEARQRDRDMEMSWFSVKWTFPVHV